LEGGCDYAMMCVMIHEKRETYLLYSESGFSFASFTFTYLFAYHITGAFYIFLFVIAGTRYWQDRVVDLDRTAGTELPKLDGPTTGTFVLCTTKLCIVNLRPTSDSDTSGKQPTTTFPISICSAKKRRCDAMRSIYN
jgi:hypothetical protein